MTERGCDDVVCEKRDAREWKVRWSWAPSLVSLAWPVSDGEGSGPAARNARKEGPLKGREVPMVAEESFGRGRGSGEKKGGRGDRRSASIRGYGNRFTGPEDFQCLIQTFREST